MRLDQYEAEPWTSFQWGCKVVNVDLDLIKEFVEEEITIVSIGLLHNGGSPPFLEKGNAIQAKTLMPKC